VAREYTIHPTQIRKWHQLHRHYAERAFTGNGHAYQDEARIAELERMVGQLTMENALLKKVLLRFVGRGPTASRGGGR